MPPETQRTLSATFVSRQAPLRMFPDSREILDPATVGSVTSTRSASDPLKLIEIGRPPGPRLSPLGSLGEASAVSKILIPFVRSAVIQVIGLVMFPVAPCTTNVYAVRGARPVSLKVPAL